jgi:hypothetical protein
MITDYVPSAVLVHDQLHIRGGHQVSWLLDGVPVPNTNIASNVGPQFDPKDIDVLEVQRGGYSAEYGDRTYGVFNVVTRSGFERNNEGEIVASLGSFNTTNDQISMGSHTQRFAYYASVNGNRTDLGLQTPTTRVLNDLGSGLGFFTSLIFNSTPSDQLRLVTSLRGDHYQVPNTPEQQQSGIRDTDITKGGGRISRSVRRTIAVRTTRAAWSRSGSRGAGTMLARDFRPSRSGTTSCSG